MINFSEIREGDEHFEEYMEHDTFKIEGRKLVRMFPLYNKGDTNENPTGGRRKLVYGWYPGEAIVQLMGSGPSAANSHHIKGGHDEHEHYFFSKERKQNPGIKEGSRLPSVENSRRLSLPSIGPLVYWCQELQSKLNGSVRE